MFYRVVQPFNYRRAGGAKCQAKPGHHVDIVTKDEADRLIGEGKIAPVDLPPIIRGTSLKNAAPLARTMRVGLFLYTSPHYSGGRIHLFQYAHTLRSLGAEVFYISNMVPPWKQDYHESGIKFLIWGRDTPPEDLDVLMTDGKGVANGYAHAYRNQHPRVKLFVLNFETPNWVKKFAPKIADKIASGHKGAMQTADGLVANSHESARHMLEWIGQEDRHCDVLLPAVNTIAVKHADSIQRAPTLIRPYAVWSARGQIYKGAAECVKAIWQLNTPFDLVTFGTPTTTPAATPLHQMHCMGGAGDAVKLAIMRHAHVTLAPSLFEGFGMVPAESLAMGTQVVAYDLPVFAEEYGDVPGFHRVKHGDVKAFIAKVEEVATSPKPVLDPKPVREKFGLAAMKESVQRLPCHAMTKKRVSCQMIAYWGFLPESLESVYEHVDEILIAYGPDRNARPIDDGSLKRIRAFPDPDKKIRLEVREQWHDKRDMREWCHKNSTGNFQLILDGDEIWVGFKAWLDKTIYFGAPRWVTLWHDADHYVIDGPNFGPRWGKEIAPYGCICGHYRWSWLRRSYRWGAHCRLEDANRKALRISGSAAAQSVPECVIYHLGHVLHPQVMRTKHKFYRTRDGDDDVRRKRESAWHNWKGQEGDCGDGTVKKIHWDVPDIVRRAVASAKEIRL
jgi:glycosyltransferase involved in cell wall biosynthesis